MSSEICNTTETTAYGWAVRTIHAEARTVGIHDEAITGIPDVAITLGPIVTSATAMTSASKFAVAIACAVALNR